MKNKFPEFTDEQQKSFSLITIEQKNVLEDIVINIVTPIILWLDFFEKYQEMCPVEKLAEMLKEICLKAQEKVHDFKCENHCLNSMTCRDSTKTTS